MQTVIGGMGEIGSAWYQILSEHFNVVGVDLDKSKCRGEVTDAVDVLHICIPFFNANQFVYEVIESTQKYNPTDSVVIHSTVKPNIVKQIQERRLPSSLTVYSPFRGVHSRMIQDMRRYTKYWATTFGITPKKYIQQLEICKIPHKQWNGSPESLELAKLLMDVTYYGWLIIFAQHTRVLADRYGVDEKQLWEFTDEIHRYLGNRPRMDSGNGIGGHCVLPDKNLLDDEWLDMVFAHDQTYRRRYVNG